MNDEIVGNIEDLCTTTRYYKDKAEEIAAYMEELEQALQDLIVEVAQDDG